MSGAATGRGVPAPGRIAKLCHSRDFEQVLRRGMRRSVRGMNLLAVKNHEGYPRFGLVVPRSVGNAVRRNRVKRILREYFRQHPELFTGSRDFVVMARPPLAEISTREVWGNLEKSARDVTRQMDEECRKRTQKEKE